MPGGKGKSVGGGKAAPKDAAGKGPKSHSAKAGLQVSFCRVLSRELEVETVASR